VSKNKFLLLFVSCALIPIIAAKVSLSLGWFKGGDTNKGVWLEHDFPLIRVESSSAPHWYLAYVQGDTCTIECEYSLYILQQLYSGLGRKQMGLQPLLVATVQPPQLTEYPALKWRSASVESTEVKGQILLLNQQGIAILRYLPTTIPGQIPALARDIRSDLLRLMNYDRSSM